MLLSITYFYADVDKEISTMNLSPAELSFAVSEF